MKRILASIFCPHQNITWPRKREGEHYVCCLDCSQEIAYDWAAMKIGEIISEERVCA